MTRRPPRLLIEDWLPAAAIGVECIRERSTGQQPPDKRLHVWWARRPLTVSRAAVLGSLLPAEFPREVFERLLEFGRPGKDLVEIRRVMDTGVRVEGSFGCERAFKRGFRDEDLAMAHGEVTRLWGDDLKVLDPMAGGGSIPLESVRLGFRTIANEYNPVACTVLEATTDYPFRFGRALAEKAKKWGKVWEKRIHERLARFYPAHRFAKVHAYIFARTVPCPDTQHHTPLVPDWHILKPKEGLRIVAEPIVDQAEGTWTVRIRELGREAGQLREPPAATYSDGKGISLFTDPPRQIPVDYIKAKAQAGEMKSTLYAVAVKTTQGLRFQPPGEEDLKAIEEAEKEMARSRRAWETENLTPNEEIPAGDQPGGRFLIAGIRRWAEMFSSRQLLSFAVLVDELRKLKTEVSVREGIVAAQAIEQLLSLAIDKLANHNSIVSRFESTREAIKGASVDMATSFTRPGQKWLPATPAPVSIGPSRTSSKPTKNCRSYLATRLRSPQSSPSAPRPTSPRSPMAPSPRSSSTRPMTTTSSTRS